MPIALNQGALWSSSFRPFFLLGAFYGPLLMLHSIGIASGLWDAPSPGLSLREWHGHEITFGFATAIVIGVVLTALPSWAQTEEIRGKRLQWLTALWIAGRFAMVSRLPPAVVALIDCLLFPVVAWMLAPQLLSVANRHYRLILPVLAGLFAGNLVFHLGRVSADHAAMDLGLRLAIHSIVLIYVLKSGVLIPVFTGNALREKKLGEQARFLPWLEGLAFFTPVALALTDLSGAPSMTTGAFALLASIVHGLRLARWRGWRVLGDPLLLMMHLGYLWLVVAFVLRAAADFGWGVPAATWLHAFTVGALGTMMISMLSRVSLRHTGRPLCVPWSLLIAFAMMCVAGVVRVAVAFESLAPVWLMPVALLWSSAFIVFLYVCGSMLWRPGLPQHVASRRGQATM